MKRNVLFCDCHSPDHNVVFEVDSTEIDGVTRAKDLMIYVNLRHYQGFWKRAVNAYKYLFKVDVNRVDYLDIIVSDAEQLQILRDKIDEVIAFNRDVA